MAEMISLKPKLCHLGDDVMWAKISCSSYPLIASQPGLQRLCCLWMTSQVSAVQVLLDCGREGLESVHRLLQGPQLVLRSICLFPDAQMGETPPESLDIWFWIPQFPQRHFCFWNDVDFLLLSGVQKYKRCLMSL